ncbi:MAG TPA: UpxY family transcription antiterminator [Terriglobales bacterium]|nr:UpxY family transcription antiterminator [Terriglobales bacterium]
MSSSNQFVEPSAAQGWLGARADAEPQWYAIHTRAQHEKAVVFHLKNEGINAFLPLVSEVHRWSDRRKVVEVPLFSCYAFVNLRLVPETWAKVLRVNGVLRFVGIRGEGVPIPENQVESIRALVSGKLPYTVYPFLKVGQRVRVRGGSLDGVEGILIARNGNRTLVISVEPIQRSLAVSLDGYQIQPI